MVLTYKAKDVEVRLYIDDETAGLAPDGTTETWASDAQVLAVATNIEINIEHEITAMRGMGNVTRNAITAGGLNYSFTIDSLYTTDLYGAKDLIGMCQDRTKFAMRVILKDETPATDVTLVLTDCLCESSPLTVSEDGDVTVNLTGVASDMSKVIA